MEETSSCSGAVSSASMGGIWLRMVSNRGVRSFPSWFGSREAVPALPEQKMMGLSSWSSEAFRSMRSSKISSCTSEMRASGRSILLTTMISL